MTSPARAPAARASKDGVWSSSHRYLTLGLVLTVSMAAFEALAVATVLPATVADIGGVEWYGWAFSAFMIANIVGTSLSGGLADRRGPAPPFLLGVILFVGGLLAAGLSPTMPLLVLGRLAQGLGAGAIAATSYVVVARAYAPAARPRMMALLSSAWVVPGLISPVVAASIATHLGWRWIFFGLAPLTAAAAAWTIPSLRQLGPSANSSAEPDRTVTALCLAAGTGAVLFGLDGQPILVAVPLVVAGVVLGTPALRRLVPRGTLRIAEGPPAAIAVLALVSAAFFGAEAFLPLTLTLVRGQSATMVGLALTAATLSWTAGAWIQARLATRISRRRICQAGLVLCLVGVATTGSIVSQSMPVFVTPLTWGISGLGMGLAYSTVVLEALDGAPSGQEGAMSAAVQLASVLGIGLGTGLAQSVRTLGMAMSGSEPIGLGMVGWFTAALAVLAVLAGFRLRDGDR